MFDLPTILVIVASMTLAFFGPIVLVKLMPGHVSAHDFRKGLSSAELTEYATDAPKLIGRLYARKIRKAVESREDRYGPRESWVW